MVALRSIEFRNAVARAAGHPWRVELTLPPGVEGTARPQLLAYDMEGRMHALLPVPREAAEGPEKLVVEVTIDLRVRVAALGLIDLAGGEVEGPRLLALDPLHASVLAVDGPLAGTRAVRPLRDDGCLLEVMPRLAPAPALPKRRRGRGGSALAFLAGTEIETPDGARPIEELAPGDLVTTRAHGPLPIRLILRESHDPAFYRTNRDLWPVRVARGALGFGAPLRDLWVAPGQKLLFSHVRLGLMFEGPSAMVRAKSLAAFLDRVEVDSTLPDATYYHLALDHHAVIRANGAAVESLRPDPAILPQLSEPARDLLVATFPTLDQGIAQPEMAFPTLRSWEVMAAVA